MRNITGKIHSFETCGTVDGPGLRFIVFLQGCPLRCQYCHNPDSWNPRTPQFEKTAEEVLAEILKYKSFIKNGGVTVSGGEPMLQAEFITELFKLLKQENIHTAIDTSGIYLNDKVKETLKYTDLVLLDIKAIDGKTYKDLTNVDLAPTLNFFNYLEAENIPTWIRHVLVPNITDDDEMLNMLADRIASHKVVERVDILPYHTHGEYKWTEMEMEYPLKGMKSPSQERVDNAKKIFEKKGLLVK